MTGAITGTNTAFEQAGIVMESYNEKKARVQARFEDFKISVFNATGSFGIWVETVASALVPLAQLTPLIQGVGKVMLLVKAINFSGVFAALSRVVAVARINLLFMNRELITGQMASIGFLNNVLRATIAVGRFATVGLYSAIKALGAWVLSLVTGGAASLTFAGVASGAFAAFKVAATVACRAVGIAIMNIPIIGWIAAAIAGLIALGVYFWNTSVKFRAALKGLGAAFVATFKGIWELAKNVFSSIGDLIVAAFSLDGQGIRDAIARLKGGFSDFGASVGKAFNDAYEGEIARSKLEQEEKERREKAGETGEEYTPALPGGGGGGAISGGLAGLGGNPDRADKIRHVNIVIQKLVENFNVHTTNLHDTASKVKDKVTEALVNVVNDSNYAM
jgi:hypothetical protein